MRGGTRLPSTLAILFAEICQASSSLLLQRILCLLLDSLEMDEELSLAELVSHFTHALGTGVPNR